MIIATLALALWQSRNFGFRAGLFPWVIGIPTLILAVAQLGRDLYGKKKKKELYPGETPGDSKYRLKIPSSARYRLSFGRSAFSSPSGC